MLATVFTSAGILIAGSVSMWAYNSWAADDVDLEERFKSLLISQQAFDSVSRMRLKRDIEKDQLEDIEDDIRDLKRERNLNIRQGIAPEPSLEDDIEDLEEERDEQERQLESIERDLNYILDTPPDV